MSEDNGQHPFTAENTTIALPTRAQPKPKRYNAKRCPLAIKERIVNALAAGDSKISIARHLQVSANTVRAVAEQEWCKVEQRKTRIAAQAELLATKAFDLLHQKIDANGDNITVNQLVPIAGVSVDKLTILRGDVIHVEHAHQHIHAHITNTTFDELLNKLPSGDSPPLPPSDSGE